MLPYICMIKLGIILTYFAVADFNCTSKKKNILNSMFPIYVFIFLSVQKAALAHAGVR